MRASKWPDRQKLIELGWGMGPRSTMAHYYPPQQREKADPKAACGVKGRPDTFAHEQFCGFCTICSTAIEGYHIPSWALTAGAP